MTRPVTRYAQIGDDYVAFQVLGRGPIDAVLMPSWFSNVEAIWDLPPLARFVERVAEFSRLVIFDRRGTGLSDPLSKAGSPFLEHSIDDLMAVLDEAGFQRTALIGCDGGGPVAMAAAATHPDHFTALVLVNTFARMAADDDYPAGIPRSVLNSWVTGAGRQFVGDPAFALNAPSAIGDEELGTQFSRYLRYASSPGLARATRQVLHDVDVRDVLASVQLPTLVIHRDGDRMIRVDHGRYLAEHIPNARLVELPGEDHLFYVGDVDAILGEVEEFLTGARHSEATRMLATVMFTDIVRSTEVAAAVGDQEWRQLLDEHDRAVTAAVQRAQGQLVKATGDGVLATFDGPGRAVRCAVAIRDAVRDLGLSVRAGLHTGEVERRRADITGMAVVIARRICDLADAGEIVVSRTVTDLVVGSGLSFAPRGTHALKGVPAEWTLFAVADE
jgi:class 3 adenylate cyclase